MATYSVSRINTYLENPWKHWCKYVAKYKPIYNPDANKYMDRGTVFHRAMELLSNAKGELTFEDIQDTVRKEATEKGFLEFAQDSGLSAVERYTKVYGYEPFKEVKMTEFELRYTLPNGHDFLGYIDAVIDNGDGTVTLVDYKTYSKSPDAEKLKNSLQAHMYMYVATQLGWRVRKFIFDCVNPSEKITGRQYTTKRVEFRYNQFKAEETFEQFCELVNMIEAFPDFRMYVYGDYMPDVFDYLYKVYVGEVVEDLDEFILKNFEKAVDN